MHEIFRHRIVKGSGFFKNVAYYCPTAPPKNFQRMLAIEYDTKAIIAASNSYMTDNDMRILIDYENKYHIYKGLYDTYQILQIRSVAEERVAERCIMFSNSFTGTNSGHDLGTLCATLLFALQQQTKFRVVVQELGFKYPRILELLELFYPKEDWIIVSSDKLYFFEHLAFTQVHPCFIVLEYKTEAVKSLISDMLLRASFFLTRCGIRVQPASKIVLIKQLKHESVRTSDAFYGQETLANLKRHNWILLNPEIDDMRYMIVLLSQASRIVISYGAIMWTHMLFFNPKARVIYLQVHKDNEAYAPAQNGQLRTLVLSSTNLDDESNSGLLHSCETV